jgi:hypothetical protein
MSHSQPTRRPQGARQRTGDRDRQPSLPQASPGTPYSTSEDGVLLSGYSSQGTNLSRSTNRGGTKPQHNYGSSSAIGSSNEGPLFQSSSNPVLVDTPRSINTRSATGSSEHRPFLSPTKDSGDSSHGHVPRYFASPVPSMSSLPRGGDSDYFQPPSRRGTDHEQHSALLSFTSDNNRPPLQDFIPPPRQSSVPPQTGQSSVSPGQPEPSRQPLERPTIKRPSTDVRNEEEISESSDASQGQRRWATLRRAVRPTQEPPVPPVPKLPSDARNMVMGVQSSAGSTSGLAMDGAAGNIYSPESGSAVSSISNLGLAPPPSTVSSASSNTTHASRSARAVMRLQNVVEQARANVGAGISGMGGGGLGGRANFGIGTGGQTRGHAATRSIPQLQELETPFAKDLLQACWAAKLGTDNPIADSKHGIQVGLNTLGSAAAIGLGRPVRAAVGDGSSVAPAHASAPSSSDQTLLGPHPTENKGSLRPLHHLIASHASGPNRRATHLPYHSIVLSVLLSPFLLSVPTSTRGDDYMRRDEEERRLAEEEQWLAIEIFELLCNGWANVGEPHEEVDRWLWCCRAAAQDSLSSKVRARILTALNGVISRPRPVVNSPQPTGRDSDPRLASSPLAFPKTLQTVLQSLFLIYPRVYGTGMEASMQTLHNIVARIEYGDIPGSEMRMEDLEKEYSTPASNGESVQEARAILFTEAAAKMLETGSNPLKRWFLHHFIEVSSVSAAFLLALNQFLVAMAGRSPPAKNSPRSASTFPSTCHISACCPGDCSRGFAIS